MAARKPLVIVSGTPQEMPSGDGVSHASGGTGLTATPSNGQIPVGNGSGYTLAAISAGANVTVTNGAGSITIAASGGGAGANIALYQVCT